MTLNASLKSITNQVLITWGGGQSQFFTCKANGSDIFLTAAITFQAETNKEDVDLAAAGERVDGIVVGEGFPNKVDLDKDSDDCYDDNSYLRCYRPIAQDHLYATTATNTSITKDDWVKYSGGFLTGATNKNDAIGKLDNGGTAVTGASATEYIVTIRWGSD